MITTRLKKTINRKRTITTRPHSYQGFTLIEMIVATVLLTIGVVGAMGAIHAAAQTTIIADGAQTAAMLAQKQITQLELQPDQVTGGDQPGECGDEYPGYSYQQNIEATDYPNLFKVTMTISWGSKSDLHKRDFITYLPNGQTAQNMTTMTPTAPASSGTGGTNAKP